MALQAYEYVENDQAFKFQAFDQSETQMLEELFKAYQKLQDIMCLKFPMGQYFRIAKIKQILKQENQLLIQFYYEGNNGHKHLVNYGQQFFQKALPLSKIFPNKQKLDVLGIKSVFQSLIEVFHWSANFGLFFDPTYDNLLYKEMEGDFYIFIPSFLNIAKQIAKQKKPNIKLFEEFRNCTFQNLTFIFLLRLLNQFIDLIKQQDEDIYLYTKIRDKYKYPEDINMINPYSISETCFGVDFIYSEDLVKKKMIRYGLKQSQFLYQLNKNEILKAALYKFLDSEKQILDKGNSLGLIDNTVKFFKWLKNKHIQGTSQDIYTPFLKTLVTNKTENKINTRRNWKQINTKHELDFIESNKQINEPSLKNLQGQDQGNSENFDIKWSSLITPQNIIYMPIPQSGQLIEKEVKKLTIIFKIEMLEEKNCFLLRTQVPEILFGIDTADDIAFFVNSIQKEKMPTNIYVDDQRKMTFYTALLTGTQGPILWEILKIIDIHQIYFYQCLDFYIKNISQGKQIREGKYSSFLTELKNLLKDYEQDSKQIYMAFQNQQQMDGF